MRRDRHGRNAHVDNDERRRPPDGFRLASWRRFRLFTKQAIDELPDRFRDPLNGTHIHIRDVPPVTSGAPHGAHFVPADVRTGGPELVVYRRMLELRARDQHELRQVIGVAIGEAVARALRMDDDLDDLYDD